MPQIKIAHHVPMQLGECPLWHAEQAALYWIDISAMKVHKLRPENGEHDVWQLPAEPGCIGLHSKGGLIVAMRHGVAHLNTHNGVLTPIADAPYDHTRIRFNDGRCDPAGRFWVGTLYQPRNYPGAQLYKLEKNVLHAAGHPVTVSNGLGFSNDGLIMYHSDTTAHTIYRYQYNPTTGVIGSSHIFHQFSMDKSDPHYGGRPDGAAVDSEDAYWCAMYEGGRLLRFSPTGKILQEIFLPVRCPTMLAFGDADLRTLYITSASEKRSCAELKAYPASGCLLSLRVDVPGKIEPVYID